MTKISELLRETMDSRFSGSVTRLAEACEVSVQMASKWVSERPRYHSTPGPKSCEKIAEALGLDPDYVLELAGHRRSRGQVQPTHDPGLAQVTARWPHLSEGFKEAILRLTIGKQIAAAACLA